MIKAAVAIIAGVILVGIDWLLLATAFLYSPTPADWIGVVGLLAFSVAISLRIRWLIFVIQNAVTILLIVRTIQYFQSDLPREYGLLSVQSAFVVASILITNFLAWLVARALPQRSWTNALREHQPTIGK